MLNSAKSPKWTNEKWKADFSCPKRSCFEIKPEISSHVYLDKTHKKSLFTGLKRKNSAVFLDMPESAAIYTDHCLEAQFNLESFGGYCSAGLKFRGNTHGSYYLALVSSKGFFRLDAVENHIPRALTGWTEAPADGGIIKMGIIALGDHLIFTVNGKWVAEVYDDSIPGGRPGFALVSYGDTENKSVLKDGYVCQAKLYSVSVDSRFHFVESEYKKWTDINANISMVNRLQLAESLLSLDRPESAYDQILKTWKQREETSMEFTAVYAEIRTKEELLFAARLAFRLGKYDDAEEYIESCLEMCAVSKSSNGKNSVVEWDALAEKAIILSAAKKHKNLADFLPVYINKIKQDKNKQTILPALYTLNSANAPEKPCRKSVKTIKKSAIIK